jgi:hypothetical protein
MNSIRGASAADQIATDDIPAAEAEEVIVPESPVPSVDSPPVKAVVQPEVDNSSRPGVPEQRTDYNKLAADLGVTSDQVSKSTQDYALAYGDAVKNALSSGTEGFNLDFIAALEENKKNGKFLRKYFNQYFLKSLNVGFRSSKELKALKKSIKKAESLSGIFSIISTYPPTAENGQLVQELYSNAISLLLYGQGNIQADNLARFLSSQTLPKLDAAEGEAELSVYSYLDKIIGEPGSRFSNQNTDPDQAVSAKITADLVMLSNAEPRVNLANIMTKMSQARPKFTDKDKHVEEAVSNLSNFKRALDENIVKFEENQSLNDTRARRVSLLKLKVLDLRSAQSELNREKNYAASSLQTAKSRLSSAKSNLDNFTARVSGVALTPDQVRERTEITGTIRSAESELELKQSELNKVTEEITQAANDIRTKELELERLETEAQEFVDKFNQVRLAFKRQIKQVIEFIESRMKQQAEGGLALNLDDYPLIKALREIYNADYQDDESNEALTKAILGFADKNSVELDIEISKIKESFGNVRNFTQKEYAVGVLTEYYKERFNYTEDTARLMASSHYVRMQKEHRLESFRKGLLEERANASMKGVNMLSAKELVMLVSRERMAQQTGQSRNIAGSARFDTNEVKGLEGLDPSMSLDEIRKHISTASISVDALTFMLYNLVSFYVPRRLADGSMATIKNPKEIALITSLTDKITKYLSEYAALKTMQNTKNINAAEPGMSNAQVLAKGLESYMAEFDKRELSIIAAAKGSCSNITSKAQLKARRNEILEQAEREKWSKAELEDAIEAAGLSGLQDGTISSLYYMNKAARPLKWLGGKTLGAAKTVGNYVRNNPVKALTAPVWVAPYLGYKLGKKTVQGVKKVASFTTDRVKDVLTLGVQGVTKIGNSTLGILGLPIVAKDIVAQIWESSQVAGKRIQSNVRRIVDNVINGQSEPVVATDSEVT